MASCCRAQLSSKGILLARPACSLLSWQGYVLHATLVV
jgi:hypothetical protein